MSPGIVPLKLIKAVPDGANFAGMCLHKHHVKLRMKIKVERRIVKIAGEIASTLWCLLLFCILEREPGVAQ